MDEADDSRTPDGSQGALPEDDVEALLAQAESLASDLAADAEVEEKDRSAGGAAVEDGASDAEAVKAADRATGDLDEVDALLNDAEAEAAALFEAEKEEKAKGGASAYGLDESDLGLDSDLVGEAAVDLTEPGEETPEAVKEAVKKAEAAAKKAAQKAKSHRKKRDAAKSKEKAAAKKAEEEEPEEEEEPPVDVSSLNRVQRVLYYSKGTLRRTIRGLRTMRRVLQNAALQPFIMMDKPFAGMNDRVKHVVGVVGLITFVMGVLIWVLPRILNSNPYTAMPPLPVKATE